jgi:hypothetical protein
MATEEGRIISEAWRHLLDGYRLALEVEGLPEREIGALAAGLKAAADLVTANHPVPGAGLPKEIEVAPGISKPVSEMTPEEMQRAGKIVHEVNTLTGEVGALYVEAVDRELPVPAELRARIDKQVRSTFLGGNSLELVVLRNELRAIVQPEAGDE